MNAGIVCQMTKRATICVIGAGPSGSTFAARMAQLGHDVYLIERAAFPRSHLGESLSPGVLPLLEATGAREVVEAAGFLRVQKVMVSWGAAPQIREDAREQGLLVDRGRFDQLLLARAQALGVNVLQPAHVVHRELNPQGWTITIDHAGLRQNVHADFLADARGRSGGRKQRHGPATLALYGYWRGRNLPAQPRIEAGRDCWYWGVPLPDGSYNTLVFVDAKTFRRSGTLETRFHELLARSSLMTGCHAGLAGPVLATDATPCLASEIITSKCIALGDAALALDPISSSGVQKAIQSALAGAVVVNTLLRKPASQAAAMQFYQSSMKEASDRHRRWAGSHYATAALRWESDFWRYRAAPAEPDVPALPVDAQYLATRSVVLSPDLVIADLPCIEGDFVVVKKALRHPRLETPLAYLNGHELAPLMLRLPPHATPLQIAKSWNHLPLKSALSIAIWLLGNGILVERSRILCAS